MTDKTTLYTIIFAIVVIFFIFLIKKKGGIKDWDETYKASQEVELDIKFPNGSKAKMVCPEGMSIYSTNLKYGDVDGSCLDSNDEVIQAVMEKDCYGKNECDFAIQDDMFNVNKECPSKMEKMLWGKYKCKRR